jgi:hypothetical protein
MAGALRAMRIIPDTHENVRDAVSRIATPLPEAKPTRREDGMWANGRWFSFDGLNDVEWYLPPSERRRWYRFFSWWRRQ